MHDDDAMFLEFGDVLLRLVASGLDDLDAAFDNGLPILGIRRRFDRWQNGEINSEGLVGQGATA